MESSCTERRSSCSNESVSSFSSDSSEFDALNISSASDSNFSDCIKSWQTPTLANNGMPQTQQHISEDDESADDNDVDDNAAAVRRAVSSCCTPANKRIKLQNNSSNNKTPLPIHKSTRCTSSIPLTKNKENITPGVTAEQQDDDQDEQYAISCTQESNCNYFVPPASLTQSFVPPSELDLLVSLIERERGHNLTQNKRAHKQRRRKASFCRLFKQMQHKRKKSQKHFEASDNIGHQQHINEICLQVLDVQRSFGAHVATVEFSDSSQHGQMQYILLDAKQAAKIKKGSKLLANFDADCTSWYKMGHDVLAKEQQLVYVTPFLKIL